MMKGNDMYIVTLTTGNDKKVICECDSFNKAESEAKKVYEKSPRGSVTSIITGKIENGKISGKYTLLKSWY